MNITSHSNPNEAEIYWHSYTDMDYNYLNQILIFFSPVERHSLSSVLPPFL